MIARSSTICLLAALALAVHADHDAVPYRQALGSKSAYWDQRQQAGYGANESTHVADQVAKMQNQLTLVQVQQVTRHGSRFPTKGNIARIETVLNKLQTTAAPTKAKDHLAWLSGYKLPYNVSVEGELSDTGSAELQRFGQRTRAWLPTTEFPTAYSNDKYAFSHTYKSRTKASAHGFVSGFFKDAANVDYNQSPKDKDVLLRFYDQCERYTKTVDKNETAQKEFKKFAKSDAGDRVVQRFTANLGLTDSANITFKDVDAAFSACAIDLAVYNSSTHWCSLIDNELAQVMEFAGDLEDFYTIGGGYALNYEIASPLLKDIVNKMDALIAGNSTVVGHFRFAHAETTLPLATLLGFGDRTAALKADFTSTQMRNRGFRTSVLAPFAANVEFRLWRRRRSSNNNNNNDKDQKQRQQQQQRRKCENENKSEDNDDDLFVQVLVNERPSLLPGCDGQVFCPFAKAKALWKPYVEDYDFDQQCAM